MTGKDTGSKPFVCKDCSRAFARQDALTRHEKLHIGGGSNRKPVSQPTPLTSQSDTIDAIPTWVSSQAASPQALASTPTQPWGSTESTQQSGLNGTTDIDFSLIWPDSENLFQSIMSTGTADQWQMPLGTLPFPPVVQDVNAMNFGFPESFDDRGPSIGPIPSGGSHQAVRDVTEMVTSSVSNPILVYWQYLGLIMQSSRVAAEVKAKSITSVFLDESLHMFFVRFIPTFPVLHRATFVFRECTHPLLLNAIAIGSLYLGPKVSVAKVGFRLYFGVLCLRI